MCSLVNYFYLLAFELKLVLSTLKWIELLNCKLRKSRPRRPSNQTEKLPATKRLSKLFLTSLTLVAELSDSCQQLGLNRSFLK